MKFDKICNHNVVQMAFISMILSFAPSSFSNTELIECYNECAYTTNPQECRRSCHNTIERPQRPEAPQPPPTTSADLDRGGFIINNNGFEYHIENNGFKYHMEDFRPNIAQPEIPQPSVTGSEVPERNIENNGFKYHMEDFRPNIAQPEIPQPSVTGSEVPERGEIFMACIDRGINTNCCLGLREHCTDQDRAQLQDTDELERNIPIGDDRRSRSPTDSSQPDRTVRSLKLEEEAWQYISTYNSRCKPAFERAKRCCETPEACLTEALGDSSGEGASMAMQLLKMGAGVGLNMAASGGIAKMCGRMQTLSEGFTVINSAMAFKCNQTVNSCNRECEDLANKVSELSLEEACRIDSNCHHSVTSELRAITSSASMCKKFADSANQRATMAAANTVAARMYNQCKKQANQLPTPEELQKAQFDADCTNPANAANPMCQGACNRPNALQDPDCRAFLGLSPNDGNGDFAQQRLDAFLARQNQFDDDEFESAQLPQIPFTDPSSSRSEIATGRDGGGGFIFMGGGGAPGGGGGTDGGGGDFAEGYDTQIDRGLASGTGYTNPPVRNAAGGGWRGYGGGGTNQQAAGSGGRPFSLKDFLPGSDKASGRKVAGVGASGINGIAPSHTDIFKQINKRFIQLCQRDALYDCSTLRGE